MMKMDLITHSPNSSPSVNVVVEDCFSESGGTWNRLAVNLAPVVFFLET